MSERIELVGEAEGGYAAHLNCLADTDNSLVLDVDEAGNDVSFCFGCDLDVPNEVSESFEVMEDGKETEVKPYADGGYDPPLWMFDGVEWRKP